MFCWINMAIHSVSGLLMLGCCLSSDMGMPFLWHMAAVTLFYDTLFIVGSSQFSQELARRVMVPYNIEYVISRQNGLFIEVLGVAVIVPAAIYPADEHTRWAVLTAEALAALLALSLKAGLLDIEPVELGDHAIRQCRPLLCSVPYQGPLKASLRPSERHPCYPSLWERVHGALEGLKKQSSHACICTLAQL